MSDIDNKIQALCQHLSCEEDEVSGPCGSWNTDLFDAEGSEFRILTDDEADEAVKDNILESLWAFNYQFLCGHSAVISAMPEDSYTNMVSQMCESANDFVMASIDDLDHFVDDAVSADGRGHFLSHYDGEENEETVNGETFYIYQTN